MQKKRQSNIIIGIIIAVGLLITIVSFYLWLSFDTPQKPLAGRGGGYNDDVQIGGKFELTDQDGNIFNSDSLKGKLSLIYFGFTYCPDICPTSLQKIMEVINTLDKYKIDVEFVFITIDPKRDTSVVLKEYLKHFNSKFIGLTGNEQQIKEVADKFKVYYAKIDTNSEDYMLDHSSFVYLMDRQGKYVKHFYLDSSAQEIIEFIRIMEQNQKRY
ncbi:MAG: SCO family protein [Rickettsia endosymbiont of Culicoides impunctatus]|uniref:SCO family protein n=1 Tax=unclassified Candidatus Tisiphia TaxID=2996318 RepID=UPI001E6C7BD4|nr:MAG: SCO family protein [Rickettsia endosymbiont of Culicoides impunctatus]